MKGVEIERLVFDLAEPAARSTGARVLDVQFTREGNEHYLRIFIEKDGGVSIDDCVHVHLEVGPALDRHNYVAGSYILQVSSPGEMPLRTVEDYRRFAPRYARIETYSPVNGSKIHEGYLAGVGDGNLMLKKGDEVVSLPLDKVSRARLAVP
jgi:ribosome maturation factor RimP